MKFAAMTFMFEPWWADGRMTHEAMIEGFASLGLDGVEPFHTFFARDPSLTARYRKALGDHGMVVSAVDVICDLVYADEAERRAGREELRKGLELCAELGAEVAHVAGHAPKESVPLPDARSMIADGLAAEADFAQAHGLTLAIEDFGFTPTLLCTAADCREVMDKSGGAVRMVFDTGNFEFAGERADENFDALYPSACYVHFKDWRRAEDRRPVDTDIGADLFGCPLGEGIVPNRVVAARLREKGYDGWVAIEAGGLLDNPVRTIRRDLATLRGWFASSPDSTG